MPQDTFDRYFDNLELDLNRSTFSLSQTSNSNETIVTEPKVAPKKMTRKVRKVLINWMKSSSTHGLPQMGKTNSYSVRVIWLLAFLAASCYSVYSIVFLALEYFAYDVFINLKIYDVNPADFPAVTFCHLNPFDHTQARPYIDAVLARNNLSYVNDIKKIDINPETVKYLLKASMAADKNLSKETLKSFGYSFESFYLSCDFNGIQCNSSDFIWFYDFEYGNCYTFNSGYDKDGNRVPIKKISEDGSDHSLRLEIFMGNELTQNAYMLQSGARAIIHNQTYRPIPASEGVILSTNYLTNIAVTRQFTNKLSSPYSDCISNTNSPNGFDSFYYKAMFNILNVTNYRQKECLGIFDVMRDFIKQACQCLDASLPIVYSDYPICTSLKSVFCVQSARANYSLFASECVGCPLECNTVSYYLQTSRSRYPTMYYTDYLVYHTDIASRFPPGIVLNENFIQKNTLVMNIYYADLSVANVIEMPAVTFDALMGNIGGYLGLFVGMSILSLVEFVEISVNIVLIFWSSRNAIKQRISKMTKK